MTVPAEAPLDEIAAPDRSAPPAGAPSDDGGGLLSGDRRPLTIGGVLLITLVGFEALAAATAFPVVLDDLGSVWLYGWTFSGYLLASIVGITLAGLDADRHGPGRPLVVGALLFAAGLVIVGAAPSMPIVVLGRVIQGLGAGVLPAVIYVVIGRAYPVRLRPKMFAVLSSAWIVPSLVGPGISGWVAEHLTWRLVFLGILPILAVAVPLTVPALRRFEEGTGAPRALDAGRVARAARLAAGAGLVLAGLGARSLLSVPLVGTGLVVGVRPFLRLMPAGTVRAVPGVPAAVAVRGLLTFAFFGAEAYLPLMLTSVRDRSASSAGIALTAAGLAWTAGSWYQARRAERLTVRRLATTGISFLVVGIAGITAAISSGVPVAVGWAGWAVAGLGMGMAYSMSSLVVLAEAREDAVGEATASVQLADVLGMALGTGFGGAVVAAGEASGWTRGTSIAVVDVVMVTVAVLAVAAATRLPARAAATVRS